MQIISLPVRSKASVTEQSDFVELEVSGEFESISRAYRALPQVVVSLNATMMHQLN